LKLWVQSPQSTTLGGSSEYYPKVSILQLPGSCGASLFWTMCILLTAQGCNTLEMLSSMMHPQPLTQARHCMHDSHITISAEEVCLLCKLLCGNQCQSWHNRQHDTMALSIEVKPIYDDLLSSSKAGRCLGHRCSAAVRLWDETPIF